jgi:alanine dehydrogenase
MHIGIPKEIKLEEHRVAATPSGVAALRAAGHAVTLGAGAGAAIGFSDAAYLAAGAHVTADSAEVYRAELIFKVKEPQAEETALLRDGQILFCYLHLAAAPGLTNQLLSRGVTAIAFETVTNRQGNTPLLAPMSQVAGRMAIQAGMQALEMRHGGRGTLLAGVPGVAPGRVVIVGGGQVGANAARIAMGVGADVTLIDRDPERLRFFDDLYQGRLHTRYSNPADLEECLLQADLTIGAVYLQGRRAPRLIGRDLVRRMPRGSALVDVAIDQGGIAETSRVTTHSAPFFVVEGVVHYGVANMPGAVARTSTVALMQATLPYLLRLAESGAKAAFLADPGFADGLYLAHGALAHAGLAQDMNMDHQPWQALV